MKYSVAIRNNLTKEVRVHSMKDIEWDDGSLWWWTEGNFSCDCNREWEFQRAGGEPITEDPICSDNRYSVLSAELEDGTFIQIDEDVL